MFRERRFYFTEFSEIAKFLRDFGFRLEG